MSIQEQINLGATELMCLSCICVITTSNGIITYGVKRKVNLKKNVKGSKMTQGDLYK